MHVSRICSELVKIRTENPPGRTDEACEYIRSFLEGLGIRSTLSGLPDGQCNLVTDGTAPALLLCGHLDVVPAMDQGWQKNPFSGDVEEGFVYGRGTTDMKGGCAAILSASESAVNRGEDLPATLAFVCDEETGGENGIQRLLAGTALTPGDCIIAEPTPARHPNIGQKGLMRLDVHFAGRPAHGSLYPAIGVSAIMEAMEFLQYVRELHAKEYPIDDDLAAILRQSSDVLSRELHLGDASNVLRHLTFNPGIITGGEKSNVVAQHCDLELEFRIPWGCRIPDLVDNLARHADGNRIVHHESHDPSITDPGSSVVIRTCNAIGEVYGGDVFPIVQWAASDARHLRKHGFRVIEYGPGELPLLHAIDERVRVESLVNAARVYERVMQMYR